MARSASSAPGMTTPPIRSRGSYRRRTALPHTGPKRIPVRDAFCRKNRRTFLVRRTFPARRTRRLPSPGHCGAVRDPLEPVSRSRRQGGAGIARFRPRPRRADSDVPRHGAGPRLRRQGRGVAAHRPARHLSFGIGPGGGGGRHRRRNAPGRRAAAELSRARRPIVARGQPGRAVPVLGRRRARQQFCRGA